MSKQSDGDGYAKHSMQTPGESQELTARDRVELALFFLVVGAIATGVFTGLFWRSALPYTDMAAEIIATIGFVATSFLVVGSLAAPQKERDSDAE